MSIFLQTAMILTPGVVRLGGLRLSSFGLCAAVGLVTALWLTQRTARLAGLPAERVWDASLFVVIAAFVISRTLLVVRDPHAFWMYPMVVLALPSLTYLGMALTVVVVVVYLWWKRLALLAVMDAWAPCAVVLAAALSVGHFAEATDAGMPTRLPWGPVVPGSAGLVHLQPVQVYGAVASLALFGVLLWMLERRHTARAKAPSFAAAMRPDLEGPGYVSGGEDGKSDSEGLRYMSGGVHGRVAGWGLVAGGVVAFGLDMLTQPVMVSDGAWLETGQWIAIGAIVVGMVMLLFLKEIV